MRKTITTLTNHGIANFKRFVITFALLLFSFGSIAQPELQFRFTMFGNGVGFTPASGLAGSSVTVTALFHNSGNAATSNFQICYYLSSDNTYSASDISLLVTNQTTINPSQFINVSTAVTIPAGQAAGRYYLIVFLDCNNNVSEVDESNNIRSSLSTFEVVVPINADLKLKPWSGPAGDNYVWVGSEHFADGSNTGTLRVAPEASLVLKYTIENAGAQRTGEFKVGYYLSTDPTITITDRRIGTKSFSALSGNSTIMTLNGEATIPESFTPGNYYFGIIVDWENSVIENSGGRETNNVWSRQLQIMNIITDNTPVWRVRIKIETGSGENDGTNDPIYAELNGKKTYLDYARNDFQRGDNDWYDLLLDNVSDYGDITGIRLANYPGSFEADGLCIAKIVLEVNGKTFFEKDFPGRCNWIDNSHIDIRYIELRQHSTWGTQPTAGDLFTWAVEGFTISRNDISSIIQSVVGTEIHGERVYWGNYHGEPVAVSRNSSNSVKVDLDLAADVPLSPDPDVDVNFKLRFQCGCDGLEIEAYDFETTIDGNLATWLYDHWPGNEDIQDKIDEKFKDFGFNMVKDLGILDCPVIEVRENGDIKLFLQSIHEVALREGGETNSKVKPGADLEIAHEVENKGNIEVSGYTVNTYISNNLNSTTRMFLGQSSGVTVDVCTPVSNWDESLTIPIELSCGSYYLISELVSPGDSDNSNNVIVREIEVGLPDLQVTSLTVIPTSGSAGNAISISASVINAGIFSAYGVNYNLELVSDGTSSQNLLSGRIGTLTPERTWTSRLDAFVPTVVAPGNYFIKFSVFATSSSPFSKPGLISPSLTKPLSSGRDCYTTNNSYLFPFRIQ